MTRFDLIAHTGTLKEYRRESDWAYRRRIRRQMRYVCPAWEDFFGELETLFWLAVACATAAAVLAVPVLFVRWWLCM